MLRKHKWKERIAAFDSHARFLPCNVIEDHGFRRWEDVTAFYEKEEARILHGQCREQLDEIRFHFQRLLNAGSAHNKSMHQLDRTVRPAVETGQINMTDRFAKRIQMCFFTKAGKSSSLYWLQTGCIPGWDAL